MKAWLRRVWYCGFLDYHWTRTAHGYYPARWATCSGCGRLLFDPHQIEGQDIAPPPGRMPR